MKIPKDVMKEIKHLKKTGIPRCQTCGVNMIKIDKYTWKHNCKHCQNIQLSM